VVQRLERDDSQSIVKDRFSFTVYFDKFQIHGDIGGRGQVGNPAVGKGKIRVREEIRVREVREEIRVREEH
jgi:cytoskeletal protein CcmA (bactofilin family)